jgi:uncharacterized phage-like protein YoqJ
MGKAIAFAGHRPQKLGGFNEDNPLAIQVRHQLKNLIYRAIQEGYDTFYSGGALGVDQWAADIIIDARDVAKEVGTTIRLIIARPYPSHGSTWFTSSQIKYKELCAKADEVINVCQDPYTRWKMQARNEFMVDKLIQPEDTLIAVWDGTPSGTGNCVDYAVKKDVTIIRIDISDNCRIKVHHKSTKK